MRLRFERFLPCQGRDFRNLYCPSDFRGFRTIFRRLPKTSEDVQANFDRFRSHFVGTSKVIIQCLIGTFSWKLNWIFVVCSDLRVRREKFSLIREIDVFSLQAWDSHIMREPSCFGRRAKSWWLLLTYRWYQVLGRQWRRWLPQIRYDDLWYVSYFVAFLLTDKCFLRFSNSSWREHRLTVCYACFFNYFTHWFVL